MILTLCLLLPAVWVLRTAVSIRSNKRHVRQLNVPTLISPVDPASYIWALLQSRLTALLKLLPFGLGSFTRYNHPGWTFEDKYRLHEELGDVFVHVSPGDTELYISNAEAIYEVCSRRRDFPKPLARYEVLNVFGKNVDSVEGHDWQRHRKVTAPAFNDRKNSLVWLESLRQAVDMRNLWVESGQLDIFKLAADTRTLSLHVLSYVGFGTSHDFRKSGFAAPTQGHSMTFRETLTALYSSIIVVMLLPHRLLSLPFLPKKLATAGRAIKEYKQYMVEMLEQEKQLLSQRAPGTGNLFSLLLRGSEHARALSTSGTKTPGDSAEGLTDSEVMGNVFIYTLAGHHTTASAISYTTLLLAIYPEWQDWVASELEHHLQHHKDIATWDYDTLFPHLKRTLALMLETLRLFQPVPLIPKYTADRPQPLTINGQTHTIPSKTVVELNTTAAHTLPKYWGTDSLVWRPGRWIASPAKGAALESVLDAETILEPTKGSYLPWSEGARICPGRKFAQVEFVAAMAVLLRGQRVRIVPRDGENLEEVKRRALRLMEKRLLDAVVRGKKMESVEVAWGPVTAVGDGAKE